MPHHERSSVLAEFGDGRRQASLDATVQSRHVTDSEASSWQEPRTDQNEWAAVIAIPGAKVSASIAMLHRPEVSPLCCRLGFEKEVAPGSNVWSEKGVFTKLIFTSAKQLDDWRAQGRHSWFEPRDYAECSNLPELYAVVCRLIDSGELLGTYDDECPTDGCPGYFRIYGLGPKATAPKS